MPLVQNAEGQVIGARCKDRIGGEEYEVYARVVVNATGPYVDALRTMSRPR